MENYRELVHELCAVNQIELKESEYLLSAVVKYEESGIKTDYCVKRLWDSTSKSEENYKKFYNQLDTLLKHLRK